jgi:class 3 adenylate cyclase/tetratricopeptide (TPR) repeat protein
MSEWACAACGGTNPEGTRFCGHCGAPAGSAGRGVPTSPDEGDVADALRSFVAGPVADRLLEAGGNIPEERRLVTALFADVSGFTALADRLDPEQLLEVIDPVISALSSVVGRHGGYVEKFAGDALMALFGAPVSHEDDAARAVRTALEMHSELDRVVAKLPHEADLTLHVGINSGHGIARILGSEARMDYAVLGDAVILAQRLESAAPPGETYVSETTVRLTAEEFDFAPVGELALKGKAEPVPTWRLVGAVTPVESVEESDLIGRESELAVLDEVVAELEGGQGGLVLVIGEAGIGKSRLLGSARLRAVAVGAQIFHARCLSYGAGVPYWPYLDVVRRATGLRADETPADTRARLGAALGEAGIAETTPYFARLLGLPIEDEAVASLEPEAFRRRMHESFLAWLRAATRDSPAVVALEDVHWADSSSLALTGELVRMTSADPVLFVLVGRPEVRAQLSEVTAARPHRAIELGPLDRRAVKKLAAGILGAAPPDELVAFVSQRTSGNPFFAQELLRAVRDSGALVPANGRLTIRRGWDERQLPPTIEGVLAARIDLVSREAASILQTASVIGRRVRVPLLEAVVRKRNLGPITEELVLAGFLDRDRDDAEPVLVFHHALVQDAAYSRLLRRRRRELHLRVARAAEALYGSGDHVIDLLARHLYLGEGPNAGDYLRRAGQRATRLYANAEAILHFERALELAPEDMELRLEIAGLHELVGDYDDALRLYEDVRSATNDVGAWRGIAATLRKQGRYDEALSCIDQAFRTEELRGADLAPLWLEQGWTLSVAGRVEQAADVLGAAIVAVDGRRDPVVGRLLLQLARTETLQGQPADALEHEREAQRIFEDADDVHGLATALRLVGDTQRTRGELDDAAAALRRGLELAEQTGSIEEIGNCLGNLAMVELERGRFDEAVADNLRAIEQFERIGHGAGRAQTYANLAWTLLHAGEHRDALDYAERAIETASAIGHPLAAADAVDTMARIALRDGRPRDAAAQAQDAADRYLEAGAAPQAVTSLELAAEALDRIGEPERARESRERARSLAPG